jgi:hypothetical protein
MHLVYHTYCDIVYLVMPAYTEFSCHGYLEARFSNLKPSYSKGAHYIHLEWLREVLYSMDCSLPLRWMIS